MVEQVYRPRRPRQSPLWQCLSGHFDAFQEIYEERYQPRYGFLRTTLGLTEVLPGIVMAIHTFGEYLDFHPHLHALVADGLFVRSGLFYVMPDASLKPLEEMFRARVITFLVDKGLLPPARADMLRGWVHSGFSKIRLWRKRAPEPPGAA